ncbi:MAG: hypothetical protein J6I45_12020 [Clostridia bacterium]|nr:hypothetical protein [Clostridia bacterium]
MKLSDLIQSATAHELPRDDLAERITSGEFEKKRSISLKRTLVCGLTAVMILTASVSAYVGIRGGFDIVFGEDADRLASAPDVTVVTSGNEDVVFEFTQAYCDEYNLHLGGRLITPEPLGRASEHDYRALCEISLDGKDGITTMMYIYPEGSCEATFYINPISFRSEMESLHDGVMDVGVKVRFIYDDQHPEGQTYYMEDYMLYDGEWEYALSVPTTLAEMVLLDQSIGNETVRVDKITATPFSITFEGEGFIEILEGSQIDPDYVPTEEILEKFRRSGGDPIGRKGVLYENELTFVLEFADGSMLGGGLTTLDVHYTMYDVTDTKASFSFSKPIHVDEIVKILITGDHYTIEDDPTVHYDIYLEIPLK